MFIFLQAIKNENDRNKAKDIYLAYKNTMFYVARGILHDFCLAEDAVSQALIKIINNLHLISDIDCNKTRGLVVIIVRNVSIDMLKHIKNKEFIPFDDLENSLENIDVSPLDHIISVESYAMLLLCISRLNQNYIDVLRLSLIYQYPDNDIANMLGISKENVRVRLHRARQALIKELQKEGICNGKESLI